MNEVYAQATPTAPGAAQQQPNFLVSFLPFILIFFVFYFLMIRPQKKRQNEEQKFLNGLSKGDEVFTKAGVIGTITGLTDRVVTLEVAEGVRMKLIRSQIAGLAKQIYEGDTQSK